MLNKIEYNAALIGKYLRNELTEEERNELEQWVNASEDNKRKFEEWSDPSQLAQMMGVLNQAESRKQEVWQKVELQINQRERKARLFSLYWFKYAAAAVLLLVTGYWLLVIIPRSNRNDKQQATTSQQQTHDVPPPDGSRTVLTLSNGQQVVLDNTADGTVASEGSANVVKQNDQLVYSSPTVRGKKEARAEILYNTLSTKKGGFFKLQLPDKSLVWLNASSSITYPTTFTGNERRVKITGEAYFEVKPLTSQQVGTGSKGESKKMPFFVEVNGITIEVLGTHFNVNSYGDDGSSRVTLLEGSVSVKTEKSTVMIKPGEQAIASPKSSLTTHHSPDLEQVMAWKNGTFYFNGEDLEGVMKHLERWYDVKVIYESKAPGKRFGGMISRNKNLSQVLRVLELSDVRFRIEDKKIIVLK